MRQIKILSILAVVILMITASSCKNGFLEGVNDNPNSPSEVTPRVLLPGAQGNLAYAFGGDAARYAGLMTQYFTGASRQFFGFNNYVFTEEDFNNLWNNMYAATMKNYYTIMEAETANPGAYTIYAGISKILMAYSLGLATDLWGDVPYSEAFLGNENLTPSYMAQQDVYNQIQTLLDEAIADMNDDPGDDFDVPDANDFIYEGDVASWIGLAYALKAKFFIHLTKVEGTAAAQSALQAINDGGAIADAAYPYNSSGPGPWYQYIEQRDDIVYDGSCLQLMSSRDDPRYGVYVDVNGDYWGEGYLGSFFSADGSPTYLMTEFERKFIEAEAKLWTGDAAGAQTAFTEAIQASMDFYGVDGAAYIAAYGTLNAGTELEQIITEKWIANYLNPESWTDMRRTGFPVLESNVPGTPIPDRFIYPTNERLYNPNSTNQNSDMYSPGFYWNP
jgi:hypothetical protein